MYNAIDSTYLFTAGRQTCLEKTLNKQGLFLSECKHTCFPYNAFSLHCSGPVSHCFSLQLRRAFVLSCFVLTCCELKLTGAATRNEFPNIKIACGTSQNLLSTASRVHSAISHSQSPCIWELLHLIGRAIRLQCAARVTFCSH